jgi:FkbM family methyltransferase
MFVKMGIVKKTIRKVALKVFNIIENNENHHLHINGEEAFLDLFFKNCKRKKIIVFDIGANNGEYINLLSEKAEENAIEIEIHGFEPTEHCFKILKNRFSKKKGVVLNNFGLSDTACEATIYSDSKGSGLTSLYERNLDHLDINFNNTEIIQLEILEKYITKHDIDHVDFIKVDVEGHELKVLQGLGKYLDINFVDLIQFEYGGTNLDAKTSLLDMYTLFKDKDFLIGKILKEGADIREYSPFMENFSYANYVAISNNFNKA